MLDNQTEAINAKARAQAAYENAAANERTSGTTGTIHGMEDEREQLHAMRASLRERVNNRLYRAELESRKAHQLLELSELLEKHPDIARILDLVALVQD